MQTNFKPTERTGNVSDLVGYVPAISDPYYKLLVSLAFPCIETFGNDQRQGVFHGITGASYKEIHEAVDDCATDNRIKNTTDNPNINCEAARSDLFWIVFMTWQLACYRSIIGNFYRAYSKVKVDMTEMLSLVSTTNHIPDKMMAHWRHTLDEANEALDQICGNRDSLQYLSEADYIIRVVAEASGDTNIYTKLAAAVSAYNDIENLLATVTCTFESTLIQFKLKEAE